MQQFCTCKFWLPLVVLISTLALILARIFCLQFIDRQYLRYINYENERQNIINHEKWQQFAGSLKLSEAEEMANEKLMRIKERELEIWQINATLKKLNGDFMKMRQEIQKSLLYKVLKRMPKGAALHVHEQSLAKTQFLLNLTYRDNLWLCIQPETAQYKLLRFSLTQPIQIEGDLNVTCKWHFLRDLRQTQNDKEIDLKLKRHFTINLLDKDVKEQLFKIKQLLKGLITFAPLWREYLQDVYLEFSADHVQYLEMRSSLPRLYDLQGSYYTPTDVIEMMRNSSSQALQEFSNFYGSGLIYTMARNLKNSEFDLELENSVLFKLLYPDFITGIDLFTEDQNKEIPRSLKQFSQRLLESQNQLDYFLSPTNFGNSNTVNDDILESYLLGSKRITFNRALLHHPYIMSKLAYKNIAVVINPIADQIFHNLNNMEEHPASILFYYNLPLVVSSDYPSYWNANPLTHDFYMVFMHIAPRDGDLRVLKQLALNSIYHSGLNEHNKAKLLKMWKFYWSQWICQINHMFV